MSSLKILIILFLLVNGAAHSQTLISGKLVNQKGEPLAGASISIENSYDGTTSAADGRFSFSSIDTGQHKILVSFMGYKNVELVILLASRPVNVDIILKELITEMEAVSISAGSFEASDKKRNTILKPLDILTTAGQQADIVSALKTLPGAQQVGETEGLFVRGGTGTETKVFIDGMMVTNPFFSSVPDMSQRSRFSPLLFKGTHFSSGGYSSQFGQGLSSVLTLETHDLPSRSETNLIISVPQLTITCQQLSKNKNASAGITLNYNNLQPYFSMVPQKIHYTKAPEVFNAELSARQKTKNGLFKFYGYSNYSILGFERPGLDHKDQVEYFKLVNKHLFGLITYTGNLNDVWKIQAGAGHSYNNDRIDIINRIAEKELFHFLPRISNNSTQARGVLTRRMTGLNKLYIGAEYLNVTDKINAPDSIPFITRTDNYAAGFTEADLFITNKLVIKPGIRFEYSSLLNEGKISPRISLAYKTGKNAQFSAAYGEYYQKPEASFLFRKPDLNFTQATHFILNFQRIADGQTFRAELFYKKYRGLISYPAGDPFAITNNGSGYAKGIELFWRDKKTFKNFSYWIAYSWLDTRRKFLDFPSLVQPGFAADHTVNLVMKQWVEKIGSMFSMTYTYASGRPYFNPNLPREQFMKETTRSYHNAGLQVNHLTKIGKANAVLIFNTNNVFGNKQVFNYRFASGKDVNGQYGREAITPMAKRYYFLGIYLTIGNDRRKEIIDN